MAAQGTWGLGEQRRSERYWEGKLGSLAGRWDLTVGSFHISNVRAKQRCVSRGIVWEILGKALACNGSQSDFIYGDYLELTPTHGQKNRAFVLPDGTIMAWSKPAGGGDLTGLGAKGVNNYNELWQARKVYG
jgi:hypothetical protein